MAIDLVVDNTQSAVVPGSKLDYALRYAAIGWHIFPAQYIVNGACTCGKADCDRAGKHPLTPAVPFGQSQATTDPEQIKKWWQRYPDANIAFIPAKSDLVVIDIDPRNGGHYTIDQLESEHGPLQSDVMAFSGGGGEHRIFDLPKGMALPGKLGKGIDIKANGYIIVEPSNHISGGHYEWEASSSPLDGAIASPLPDWLRDIARVVHVTDDAVAAPTHAISEYDVSEIVAALRFIDSDDRETWLNVGMAIHNDIGGSLGFDMWSEWSKTSHKYKQHDQYKTWKSFKLKGIAGITKLTIFKLAMDAGWHNAGTQKPAVPDVVIDIGIDQLYKAPEKQPDFITHSATRAPGVLGRVQDYYDATAKISQPMFAVQAALGCGSTMLGRMFATEYGDYTSLYFLNIAGSAKGKEHIKTVTEEVLMACGMENLIAGNGYTSQAAVFNVLRYQPSHITVVDELGIFLETANNKNNYISKTATKTLMEAIGRNRGVMRNQAYADRDSKEQRKESVVRPAITLQTMTTPSTFYKNLTLDQIADGFLGRFILHHSKMPRTVPSRTKLIPVYHEIIDWAKAITDRLVAVDPANTRASVDNAPDPIVLRFSQSAENTLNQFAHDMVELMNTLEQSGIEATAGRAAEFASRLSLIAALAVDPYAETISHHCAEWACSYMRDRTLELVSEVKENMQGSQFAADKRTILHLLRQSGDRGITKREFARNPLTSRFRDKEFAELMDNLMSAGLIAYGNVREGKPGKKRDAWFAIGDDAHDDSHDDHLNAD